MYQTQNDGKMMMNPNEINSLLKFNKKQLYVVNNNINVISYFNVVTNLIIMYNQLKSVFKSIMKGINKKKGIKKK
jgi:hypothetical protein